MRAQVSRARTPGARLLRYRRGSGDLVERPVAALGGRQPTALGGDRSALHAVGVVDDHVDLAVLGSVLGDLVHTGRAHPAPRLGDLARHTFAHANVVGRVVAGRVAGDEHRRELVERVFAVRLDVHVLRPADEHLLEIVSMPGLATGQPALGDLLQAAEGPAYQQPL